MSTPADTVIDEITREIDQAVARLRAAAAPMEQLAALVSPRRILFVRRAKQFVPAGKIWHLGVFLLTPDSALLEAGTTTRAVTPGHPNYQSASGEDRRELRAAAVRGGFPEGTAVNFDAIPVDLNQETLRDSPGRLFIHENTALVRWRANVGPGNAVKFGEYLRERVDLLINQLRHES